MKRKNILIASIIGVVITLFSVILTEGIFLPFGWILGWSGIRRPHLGFPFSWFNSCPSNPSGVPTGCVPAFNLIALILDIIFYTLILLILVRLAYFLKKKH